MQEYQEYGAPCVPLPEVVPAPYKRTVTHTLEFPAAFVGIAGSFNGWQVAPMEKWDDTTYTYDVPGDNDVLFRFLEGESWVVDKQYPVVRDLLGNASNVVKREDFLAERSKELAAPDAFSPYASLKMSLLPTCSSLTFLGTGTSSGIPCVGCKCRTCTSPDIRDKRLRYTFLFFSFLSSSSFLLKTISFNCKSLSKNGTI